MTTWVRVANLCTSYNGAHSLFLTLLASRKSGARSSTGPVASANKNFQGVMQFLHEAISRLPSASIFASPVSASDAPDYSDCVRKPMDLRTIKAHLKSGTISTMAEYERAIYLMFANAMMYNKPGSFPYEGAYQVCA